MNIFHSTFPTALGPFSVAVDDSGAIVATSFGDFRRASDAAVRERTPYRQADGEVWRLDERATKAARDQLQAFFAGKRRSFDLPIAPVGTAFQRRVWDGLARIPFGRTMSYGELATAVGNPRASRAVGSANGANPICVIIPCHRVIAADGTLGGFGFGLEIKRRLLELEGWSPNIRYPL